MVVFTVTFFLLFHCVFQVMLTYGAGDLISGGDITSIDLEAGSRPACSPPAKVQGTLIYKNGQPLHQAEQR